MDHGPVTQLTIDELAKYLRKLIPANIPESYALKNRFKSVANESGIIDGVVAYRNFLYVFNDRLMSDGHSHFKLRTNPKKDTDYPLLYSITDLLADIGYYGKLAENGDAMLITELPSFTVSIDEKGRKKQPRNSAVKLTEALRFLALCGFDFHGIDLNEKKFSISEGLPIEVCYPDTPILLTGLKVISIADIELRVKRYKTDFNHDNLLLCDYRLLKESDTDELEVLNEFLQPLPQKVRAFALDLHKYYIKKGMTCESILTTFEAHFAYSYVKNSRKTLSARDVYQKRTWEFVLSTKHGYNLVVRSRKTDKYPDVIENLPLSLQKKIEAGYGCDRKLHDEPCQQGCQGIRFPLDESILSIGEGIKTWLDKELSYKF